MLNTISSFLKKIRVGGETSNDTTTATTPLPFATYFREGADLPTPSLNALDTRSPSYLDIISYLIDTGKTPATRQDLQRAYAAIHNRIPGPLELHAITAQARAFGLVTDDI